MGQKVNPFGLRLGINRTWKSKWYVDPREYASTLHEDLKIRELIARSAETQGADIADVEIIRHPQRITIIIHTGRPGVIIGAKGANIEKLGKKLQKQVGRKIQIKIKEISRPETDAQCVGHDFGMICVNDWPPAPPEAPFGGVKGAGLGRVAGAAGPLAYLERKTVFTGGVR